MRVAQHDFHRPATPRQNPQPARFVWCFRLSMIISHRHKYLYFVIPKCASSTIRHSIRDYTDVGYPVTDYPQHVPLRQFIASEYAELLGRYFAFTFVRNPYDRLYSGFLQDMKAGGAFPKWIPVKKPIFDAIGTDFNRYMLEYVRFADISTAWEWICFCPMHEFVHLDGMCRLDWIGRAENVAGGLATLSEHLNVPIRKSDNSNVNTEYRGQLKYLGMYERATVELVNELYHDDFRLFGYDLLNPADFPRHLATACRN